MAIHLSQAVQAHVSEHGNIHSGSFPPISIIHQKHKQRNKQTNKQTTKKPQNPSRNRQANLIEAIPLSTFPLQS